MAHKVDKGQIPVCPIMEVNIAAIDMEWLLDFTKKNHTQDLKLKEQKLSQVLMVYPNAQIH